MPESVSPGVRAAISRVGDGFELRAGAMVRTVRLGRSGVATAGLTVDAVEVAAPATNDLLLSLARHRYDERPRGIPPSEAPTISPTEAASVMTSPAFAGTDTLDVERTGVRHDDHDEDDWLDQLDLAGDQLGTVFSRIEATHTGREATVQRLVIEADEAVPSWLSGVSLRVHYEVYPGFPAIRRWVEVRNGGTTWIRLRNLVIDALRLAVPVRIPLTPGGQGGCPSIVGFSDRSEQVGVIVASEVPSALRDISEEGSCGYRRELFEWVLGPDETFTSEAVFHYGFHGSRFETPTRASTPLDRAVEGRFQAFLTRHVGVSVSPDEGVAPLWCTWTNFVDNIDDATVRTRGRIAARAGFRTVQVDAGWQRDGLGMTVDEAKFPDLAATLAELRRLGLRVGLWVSCFRDPESQDLRDVPDAFSVPVIGRRSWDLSPAAAIGMSFASAWHRYYAEQVAGLVERYGVTYVKQDLSNIMFGDIADGHDSRTLRESYLRGLRGLLSAQDHMRRLAPELHRQLTHEIYWGTPGVACDLAALQHADSFHIPPNDCGGVGDRKQPYSPDWDFDPEEVRRELIATCFNARRRLYEHRGVPLRCVEYYGAATVNVRGSLTPDLQDRQICSWLLGAPLVFAGDLCSLTEENIDHYRSRFDLLERLHGAYRIFDHFQFSGVPEPTDEDWHWWGKLDASGSGAVVVLRGRAGAPERPINVPWVRPERRYHVAALLAGCEVGSFSGADLHSGRLRLSLSRYGQEILELEGE